MERETGKRMSRRPADFVLLTNRIQYRSAGRLDYPEIMELLKENDLPYHDLESSDVELTAAVLNGKIIGCIGIEKKGNDALLRSFAVSGDFRENGVGSKLYDILLEKAISEGIHVMHLLTTTAEKYFERKGFVKTDRNHAPEKIKQTREFSGICLSSSVYMVRNL